MSGGYFDHTQHHISNIADEIENVIKNNAVRDQFGHPGDIPDNVIDEFREAVKILRKARVYAQRIDWLLSGDDGNEMFIERLKDDLNELRG